MYTKNSEPVYVLFLFVFLYLLFDDSQEIHETVGGYVVEWASLGPSLGLRGQDFGELVAYASIGAVILAVGGLALKFSGRRARWVGLYLLAGLVVFAIFAVGVDMLHQFMATQFPSTNSLFTILEDGNELIVVSFITWFVFSLGFQKWEWHVAVPKIFR